jgi:hypothetical protein
VPVLDFVVEVAEADHCYFAEQPPFSTQSRDTDLIQIQIQNSLLHIEKQSTFYIGRNYNTLLV